MENRGFLINDINPGKVKSIDFSVASQAVRLRSYNIQGEDYVQLEQQVGQAINNLWSPVYRSGEPVRLSATNTQHVEIITGIYRVVPSDDYATPIAVFFETDTLLLDNNVIYNFDTLAASLPAS